MHPLFRLLVVMEAVQYDADARGGLASGRQQPAADDHLGREPQGQLGLGLLGPQDLQIHPHARSDCHQKALKAGERGVLGRVALGGQNELSLRVGLRCGEDLEGGSTPGFVVSRQGDIREPILWVNHPENVGVRRRLAVGPEHDAADRPLRRGWLTVVGLLRP